MLHSPIPSSHAAQTAILGASVLIGSALVLACPRSASPEQPATRPAQETRPATAELRRKQLLAEIHTGGEEPTRAVFLRASLDGVDREVYLAWPDSMRVVDSAKKQSVVVVADRARRLLPGGAREELAGAELAHAIAARNALAASLLWPLHDAGSVSLAADGSLRVVTKAGREYMVHAPENTKGTVEIKAGSSVTRLSSWLLVDSVRIPGDVRHEEEAARLHWKPSFIVTRWTFERGLFDPDADTDPDQRVQKLPPGTRDPRSFVDPVVRTSAAADWLVYSDPGTWDARMKLLREQALELFNAGQVSAGLPTYFTEPSGARVAIPIEPDPDRGRPPLPDAFKKRLVRKPAERVVALDFRGDPAQAPSVLPRILRFCRENGHVWTGTTRTIPSLAPSDRMPPSLEVLSTTVEVVIQP